MGGYHSAIQCIDQNRVNRAFLAEYFDAVDMIGLIDRQHAAFEMLLRDGDRFLLRDAGGWIAVRGVFSGRAMFTGCRGCECADRYQRND